MRLRIGFDSRLQEAIESSREALHRAADALEDIADQQRQTQESMLKVKRHLLELARLHRKLVEAPGNLHIAEQDDERDPTGSES